MTDIVEWLRWNAKEQGSRFGEAADEIERLRKRYAKLLEKLEYCTGYSDDCIDEEEEYEEEGL